MTPGMQYSSGSSLARALPGIHGVARHGGGELHHHIESVDNFTLGKTRFRRLLVYFFIFIYFFLQDHMILFPLRFELRVRTVALSCLQKLKKTAPKKYIYSACDRLYVTCYLLYVIGYW